MCYFCLTGICCIRLSLPKKLVSVLCHTEALTRPCPAEPPFQLSGNVFLILARQAWHKVESFPSSPFQHASRRFLDHFLGSPLAVCAILRIFIDSPTLLSRRRCQPPSEVSRHNTLSATHERSFFCDTAIRNNLFQSVYNLGPFGTPGETNHSMEPPRPHGTFQTTFQP